MTRVIEAEQAHHLAALVAYLRPTWQVPGILKALEKACDLPQATDAAAVIHAAVNAATDPANRTPAIIGMAGRHWVEHMPVSERVQIFSGPQAVPCRVPGHRFHSGEPCDGKPVRGISETAKAALAQARAELAATTKAMRDADKAAEAAELAKYAETEAAA